MSAPFEKFVVYQSNRGHAEYIVDVFPAPIADHDELKAAANQLAIDQRYFIEQAIEAALAKVRE